MHILARAVIRRGNTILLARAKGQANAFLPGGHLETGESLKTCVAREFQEELGLAAHVGSYLGMVEHTWADAAETHYELNHLFEASLPTLTDAHPIPSLESHLTFFWAEIGALAQHQLEPYPLRYLLDSPIDACNVWASTLPERTP